MRFGLNTWSLQIHLGKPGKRVEEQRHLKNVTGRIVVIPALGMSEVVYGRKR
jgi:hypothetical protein